MGHKSTKEKNVRVFVECHTRSRSEASARFFDTTVRLLQILRPMPWFRGRSLHAWKGVAGRRKTWVGARAPPPQTADETAQPSLTERSPKLSTLHSQPTGPDRNNYLARNTNGTCCFEANKFIHTQRVVALRQQHHYILGGEF